LICRKNSVEKNETNKKSQIYDYFFSHNERRELNSDFRLQFWAIFSSINLALRKENCGLIITVFFIKNNFNEFSFLILSRNDTVNVIFSSSLGFSVFYFFDEDLELVSIILSYSFIADLISDFDQFSISFFSDFIGNLIWEARSWDRICFVMI